MIFQTLAAFLIGFLIFSNISTSFAYEPPTPPEPPKAPILENAPPPPPPEPPQAPEQPLESDHHQTEEKTPEPSSSTPVTSTPSPSNVSSPSPDASSTTQSSPSSSNTPTENADSTPSSTVKTGGNSAVQNTGGNNDLSTGSANNGATVINALNTNVAGVEVSEFNVEGKHQGDIVLDFSNPCTSQCAEKNILNNLQNGSRSSNSATLTEEDSTNIIQKNNGAVESAINLGADSGNNIANQNTGGNSNITTGDANVAANIATFVNNNVAGNVIFGVVNIYGELIGNIVLPESALQNVAQTAVDAISNGSESLNSATASSEKSDNTSQSNDATIKNNLTFDTGTGDNISKDNTGGNSEITTGTANTQASVLNVANSNVSTGDTWWLVIVNKAGQWVGKILGAPQGAQMAGSSGTEFSVDSQGQVIASRNAGNGSGSNNSTNVSSSDTSNVTQANNASVTNNINLSANTGKNTASDNTGGNSNIQTGDANISANLVNFVNNNIVGTGKLIVTLVNVLGSWTGDFVTPGQTAQSSPTQNQVNATPVPSPETVKEVLTKEPEPSTLPFVLIPTQSTPQNQTSYTYTSTSYPSSSPSISTSTRRNPPQTLGIQTAQANQNPPQTLAAGTQTKVIHFNLAWLVIAGFGAYGIYLIQKSIREIQSRY